MANVLTRFADIMSANINSVLSKAEAKNADKLLEKYIADARRDLEQLKSETAAVIAEEMAQGRKLADCEANISKYTQYAEAAVRAGNDDDARKFLTYKQQESAKLADLQASYAAAKENSEKMRLMSKKLTEEIDAAGSKMAELKAKMSMAQSQEKMQQLNQRIGGAGSSLNNMDGLFDAVQKRIDKIDAQAQLNQDLDPEAERREQERKYAAGGGATGGNSVDDELAKLKAMMNQ